MQSSAVSEPRVWGEEAPGAGVSITLRSLFESRVQRCGDAPAYAFVRDDLTLAASLSYAQLGARVQSLAAWLAMRAPAGSRVLLVYPPGLEFVCAFWACVVAGMVPVPAPDAVRSTHGMSRLRAIASDAGAALTLTEARMLALAAVSAGCDTEAWIATDTDTVDGEGVAMRRALAAPTDLAYLQYTSGSTSAPRGVMITHANVLANCAGMWAAGAPRADSRLLSWLPHFHDFGLVHGILMPLYAGIPGYLMSPLTFLRRPLRWLEAIERHAIDFSGAPNFAYDSCVQALAAQPQWRGRLGTWAVASCGAEPIRAQTMSAFAEAFGPHGLRPDALAPAYGLAEATLSASSKPLGRAATLLHVDIGQLDRGRVAVRSHPTPGTRCLVGCGTPLAGITVRIVDADTQRPASPDAVGELWLAGGSIGAGYWNQPAQTEASFGLRLADAPSLAFFRTGDLGFVHDGEVFITGRRKDMLIVRGRNLYPQDIEWTVERTDAALRRGHGAAFAIDGAEGEHVVVVQEVERHTVASELPAIAAAIRQRVAAEHEVPVQAIALIRAGTIARTSSGKIRRQDCRAAFIERSLDLLWLDVDTRDDAPAATEQVPAALGGSDLERALLRIWRAVLRVDAIGVNDSFFELGGHSLSATQVVARIRSSLNVDVPLRALLEAPTIAGLARAIEALPVVPGGAAVEVPILALGREHTLALSFSQRRMWLNQRMDPDGTAYNMPFASRVTGQIDRQALRAAVAFMVGRHEALRTSFEPGPDEPVQRIAADAHVPIEEIDLRHLNLHAAEEDARALLREAALRPFDLGRAPLLRVVLVWLGEADHVLLFLLHHAVGDQWSGGILAREIGVAYRALRAGQAPALEPLRVQYADYAAWQREHLGGRALDAQLAYWRDRLAGLSPLALPTDAPRPAQRSSRGATLSLPMPQPTLVALRTLSAAHGATVFMTLLAAFKLLLARYSGQHDIAVGTPIANRTRTETESLVGTMVNTLVLRTDLGGDPSFTELLQRVRDTALQAYAHQDLPYERLVDELRQGDAAVSAPLVRLLFNVPNAPWAPPAFEGLELEPFDFDRGAAQFDLSVTVDTEYEQRIHFEYATDLYGADTVQRLAGHYLRLLGDVAAHASRPVSTLRMLTTAEYRRAVYEWNRTERPVPAVRRASELIARQAERTPAAVAISQADQVLTYGELEARANRLANHFLALDLGSAPLIGVCLPRTPELIVALLAVMKCGGAYVPLDPAFPRDRLQFMAEDAGVALVLTDSVLLEALPFEGQRRLDLDLAEPALAARSDDAPPAPAVESDLAYVLYTSGSTGRPKGVEVPHRALVNFLTSMQHEPGCTARDTLLSVTTLSFDISGLEFFLPLTVGARVELASQHELNDAHALLRRMSHCRATMMQATPSTWRMLVEAGWAGDPTLTVLCGGEPLVSALAAQLLPRCKTLWNLYGPTETTIWSTLAKVESASHITIGFPIANTTVYVLDAAMQPVPVGVTGEIHIGGRGVARGYRSRADLTGERFVLDPFATEPDACLYRTGDLARYCADGSIVHLGRADLQLKVRGHRVEPGEIEAVLARHPAVQACVVTARADATGTAQLVAYAVPRAPASIEPAVLRAHLRASLPEYMTPDFFVSLSALPLTASRKVDIQALPAPGVERAAAASPATADPRSTMAVQLTALWRGVLDDESIGMHDNFFEHGGHSLKAVQLLTSIERVYGRTLPLATLIEAPTIAQLEAVLTRADWAPPWRSLVAISTHGSKPALFAVPGVGGNVLAFAKLAALLGRDRPVYGLQARGLDGVEPPFATVAEAAAYYLEEIRSVQPRGPYFIGGTCTGGVIAFEMARRLRAQGERVGLAMMEAWHPSSFRPRSAGNGALRRLRFVAAKLVCGVRALFALPAAQRPAFLRRKLEQAAMLLDRGLDETLAGSSYYVENVVLATLHAVAVYRPQPYPGRLLNVVAGERAVASGTIDTRRAWEALATGGAHTVHLGAEDSGRLFVSPHVDALARELGRFAAGEVDPR